MESLRIAPKCLCVCISTDCFICELPAAVQKGKDKETSLNWPCGNSITGIICTQLTSASASQGDVTVSQRVAALQSQRNTCHLALAGISLYSQHRASQVIAPGMCLGCGRGWAVFPQCSQLAAPTLQTHCHPGGSLPALSHLLSPSQLMSPGNQSVPTISADCLLL